MSLASKVTRLKCSFDASDEEKLGPNPKRRVPAPESCRRRRARPQSKRSGRPSQGDGERLKVQVQFNMSKWDFINDVTGDESIVRWKEDDEEVKMVCLVVATVVQGVVELVVKFGGENGFFGGEEEELRW